MEILFLSYKIEKAPSYIVSGNTKWYNPSEGKFNNTYHSAMHLPIALAVSPIGIYPKDTPLSNLKIQHYENTCA